MDSKEGEKMMEGLITVMLGLVVLAAVVINIIAGLDTVSRILNS